MNLQEILDREKKQSFSKGIEQGAAKKNLENAKSMKTAGVGFSIINIVTGLSLEEIQKL